MGDGMNVGMDGKMNEWGRQKEKKKKKKMKRKESVGRKRRRGLPEMQRKPRKGILDGWRFLVLFFLFAALVHVSPLALGVHP